MKLWVIRNSGHTGYGKHWLSWRKQITVSFFGFSWAVYWWRSFESQTKCSRFYKFYYQQRFLEIFPNLLMSAGRTDCNDLNVIFWTCPVEICEQATLTAPMFSMYVLLLTGFTHGCKGSTLLRLWPNCYVYQGQRLMKFGEYIYKFFSKSL